MEEKYGHYNDDTEKKNRLGMNVVFGMIMIAIYLGIRHIRPRRQVSYLNQW